MLINYGYVDKYQENRCKYLIMHNQLGDKGVFTCFITILCQFSLLLLFTSSSL